MSGTDLLSWIPVPVFLYLIYTDLRYLRIPNRALFVLFCALALAHLPTLAPADIPLRLVGAAAVFALAFAAFYTGMLGGGDVKMISVVMLFVPLQDIAAFALALSVSVILSLSVIKILRRSRSVKALQWRAFNDAKRLPLGPAIAISSMIYGPLGDFAISKLGAGG
ncbi:prepilin peptidase [Sulfitobacter sp. HNIBRBA3233]|uniref:A24 family peptidase n=1 Tax=Sulfitobacter marinivivus TaxID=3158558 RepID=UPI0032E001F9